MRAQWVALAAAVAVAGLLAMTGALAPPESTAGAPAECVVLQAENEHEGAPSTLRRLALPSGATESLAKIGYWVNAMGYAEKQDLVYAVADGTPAGRFPDGAHAVTIDRHNAVADLGPVARAGARRPVWSLVTGATAGAVAGKTWYVRRDGELYTVDIDPASPDYARVVGQVALRPIALAISVDDFAYDAADGLLYGVSTSSRGGSAVVTIDPATGRVAERPGLRFPPATAYGAVVLGKDDALYATANRIGHRSVTYRLPRDGSGPVTEVATGPPLVSADAAGCLGPPLPPSTPPTTPTTPPSTPPTTPPSTPPSVEPPKSPPSSPTPVPPLPVEPPPVAPVVPPPQPPPPPVTSAPPATKPPTAPPPTPPTSSKRPHPAATPTPSQSQAADAKRSHAESVKTQRRWGVTALVLVLGAGAVATHVRRGR
ncbi:DUF6923 family protein [Amycolatopsis sp. NPDC058986]|uniref:DUF6923 family protein n=1 Tax=unclassified Amycolatopsis TaxID=2618356 RepID=UPI0036727ABD